MVYLVDYTITKFLEPDKGALRALRLYFCSYSKAMSFKGAKAKH